MVGYLAIFFLLGASMASPADLRRSEDLGIFGINITSCEAVVGDVEQVASFAEGSAGEITGLVTEVEGIMGQFNNCSTESIFKQISCYENVITEIKAAVADAKSDMAALVPQAQVLVAQVQKDAMACVGKSS